ncbi:hypothetical protein B5E84_14250 [Lachnoclostridium sp. An14]|uniref:sigma-54 interaction domain-containing protein n=1 Tax=Lachnoclostridium sp. An14 TaxID=1965562 RepID=UPI000B3652EB|nr:sigma 54-interacting transcriptional regulator [Lachnoclostridium sp. An14]OUQ15665.1 hypothetical protein B5E84_14250 [Lachnoclostridium sp. An14]
MPKKQILLWSFTPDDWDSYTRILSRFFHGFDIELITGAFNRSPRVSYETIDLVLVTTSEWSQYLKTLCAPETPIIWIKHTIDKKTYSRILEEGGKTGVSIVADTPFYAAQRVRMLENLGIPGSILNAWHPSLPVSQLKPLIVSFENGGLQNISGHEVIQFHGRGLISAETLLQIAVVLGLPGLAETDFFRSYSRDIVFTTRQISDMIGIGSYYAAAFGKAVTGLLYFVPDGLICYCDYTAEKLLGLSLSQLIGRHLSDIFPFLDGYQNRYGEFGEQVVKYQGREFVFDLWTTSTHGIYAGYILISDYRSEVEKELRLRTRRLSEKQHAKYTFSNIKGSSPSIQQALSLAATFAKSRSNVLIQGPSGTGKELFANAIHNASDRRNGPFIPVNCGAFVESLLESELFGYEGGSFTGARREGKAGLFEAAHKGTLFLDEIGEMPLGLQVKLLRVLQEREVVRVGGSKVIPIDIRIISATNRDLKKLVQEGRFRADLYYRLNVLPLALSGLNDRREDILPLFHQIAREYGCSFRLTPAAETLLITHNYEGNVRELSNCVEYLGSLGKTEIAPADLPCYFQEETALFPEKHETSEDKTILLDCVRSFWETGICPGRRSLQGRLFQQGYHYSEGKIRALLKELEAENAISIGRGRQGIQKPR